VGALLIEIGFVLLMVGFCAFVAVNAGPNATRRWPDVQGPIHPVPAIAMTIGIGLLVVGGLLAR
jgi:hypothetical protein